MGWLDSWWNRDDPLSQIDPSLRKYLEKQSPEQYKTGDGSNSDGQTYREQLGFTGHTDPAAQRKEKEAYTSAQAPVQTAARDQNSVPEESLFQDGRYAHLWKNYRPQSEAEEAGKSDQEKLLDVVGAFKDQQAEVGRAAMENCSDFQWAVQECFRSGSWSARMTMCKAENRSLSRCMTMQTQFLKALGYASMNARPAEEREGIQMHADTLYHRMLDYEKARDEAREAGLPAPPLPTLVEELSAVSIPAAAETAHTKLEHLPPAIQERLRKQHLEGLEGLELEVAKKELDQTISLNQDLVQRVQERYLQDNRDRVKRLEEGQERLGDRVKRWFDFRKYDDEESK